MKLLLTMMAIMAISLNLFAQSKPDDIVGNWMTADKTTIVQIMKSGNNYIGKLIWSKQKNRKDHLNPDEGKKEKYLLNSLILTKFEHDGDQSYINGEIYDPNSGKTYDSNLTLVSKNRLKVQGYVGITMFGRSSEWTRVTTKKTSPKKAAPKKVITTKITTKN
jgi:uncharacterized protein (DUF2147 family)